MGWLRVGPFDAAQDEREEGAPGGGALFWCWGVWEWPLGGCFGLLGSAAHYVDACGGYYGHYGYYQGYDG